MQRWALGLFLLILAAGPLRAQDDSKGPILIHPEAIQAQADELHDAVASPSSDNFGLHAQAGGLFENIVRQTPLVRPAPRVMDRESVNGDVGTVDGMIEAAQKRYDHYKFTTTEVPDAKLDASVDYAKALRDQKRAELDKTGKMPENEMGAFVYAKDKLDGGMVELNGRMALLATRIGMAFSYATLVHESTHAKERAAGHLSPEHVIDGEVEAYRVQYQWLKVLDPRAERMIVMHSTLGLYLKRHPEDQVTRASISYLEHLLQLWDTGGEEPKLRVMIKNLGYEEGDANHEGGVNPAAQGPRV
jgi:hypothetical protein